LFTGSEPGYKIRIKTMNNLSNLSLADRFAALKAEADRIAKLLDAAKAEIKATGLALVEGDMADVTVTLSERKTIDTKLVTQFLTADQIASCTKVSLVETLKVKAKVAC
jgi:hypothetical protein